MVKTPPPVDFRDKRSFAYHTLVTRFPRIIGDVLQTGLVDPKVRTLLELVRSEPANAVVEHVPVPLADQPYWKEFFDRWTGIPFVELPFFELEAYLYMYLLHATRYFEQRKDPFAASKLHDLRASMPVLSALDPGIPSNIQKEENEQTSAILSALWGNARDLSNVRSTHAQGQVLLQHPEWSALVDELFAAEEILYMVDNAFVELWYDLALISCILARNSAARITIIAKAYPMFVSDATAEDVRAAVDGTDDIWSPLKNSETRKHLKRWYAEGRLSVHGSSIMNAPLHFTHPAFRDHFGNADLTIIKGDANYRRAFEDRPWQPGTPLVSLWPDQYGPACFLRVLKSDCVLGIEPDLLATLSTLPSDWRTSGHFGIVQSIPNLQQ